ncbi:hypothetical protein HCCG_01846 [Helicobacter cinaedi CCUG 18818 = ATCC BAA-847]|uniref:Uncharacterized protein n=1 Tax=Helicobacter cinaedi CCUG 18818 = ATCC BAA-847 TaxID=537971 RepID=A0ABN0BEF1_9HELI|nr:hypothetical protein HCCG_01846 [Helicobacter cinaedi CCUG 18818 = ATCC BAA-847]
MSPNEILLALFVAFLGYAQWGNAHLGVLESLRKKYAREYIDYR